MQEYLQIEHSCTWKSTDPSLGWTVRERVSTAFQARPMKCNWWRAGRRKPRMCKFMWWIICETINAWGNFLCLPFFGQSTAKIAWAWLHKVSSHSFTFTCFSKINGDVVLSSFPLVHIDFAQRITSCQWVKKSRINWNSSGYPDPKNVVLHSMID